MRLALPADFRRTEPLAFHGRDPMQAAEQVSDGRLVKGIVLAGRPVRLEIELADHHVDFVADTDQHEALAGVVRRMLGLHIDPNPFEAMAADDDLLASTVASQRGLRIPNAASPFEALTWAIIGQQVTVSFAVTLRRRLIELAGVIHASGLHCYPTAGDVARIDAEALAANQFSRAKAAAILNVAHLIDQGELDLDALSNLPADEAESSLTRIKGIGPWTAHYALMRGLGAMDCSLHGDVAVRAALGQLLPQGERPDINTAKTLLARYRPYRSLAAAHLWASRSRSTA